MTTLVETSEEDPTLAVARAIAEIAWSQGGADVSGLWFPCLFSLKRGLNFGLSTRYMKHLSKVDFLVHVQIAEPAVAQFCEEAESYLIGGRYSDLVNLLLTSADLVLANASEKGQPTYDWFPLKR